MNLVELKERGLGLLRLCRDRCEEYGKAYIEILKMCDNYAGPKLSDQILISDIAHKYAAKQESNYILTKQDIYLQRIKAASELYISERVSFDDVHKILYPYKRKMEFEEAKEILRETHFYNNIGPDTLIEVLHFIELHLEST
jgi:hypothetical protein